MSIGHRRPLASALCSGLLWLSRPSCFLAALVLPLCLASSCCEGGLSSSFPGQGLACGTGCWFHEGLSDPAPIPPQNLLGHLFLSRSLQQIFILDFLWPSNLIDTSQRGVEECLYFLQHCFCCTPCLTSIEENRVHVGVEDAQFGSCADSLVCPDVLEHDKCSPCLANPSCNIPVRASLFIHNTSQLMPCYVHWMREMIFSGTQWCLCNFHSVSLSTLSKAFSESMKSM